METRPAQPVEMRLRPRRKTFSDNIFPQENYDKMCRRQQRVIVIELSSSSSSSNHRNDHRCNELRLRHWQEKHAARSRTAFHVRRSESCSTAPGQLGLLLAWPGLPGRPMTLSWWQFAVIELEVASRKRCSCSTCGTKMRLHGTTFAQSQPGGESVCLWGKRNWILSQLPTNFWPNHCNVIRVTRRDNNRCAVLDTPMPRSRYQPHCYYSSTERGRKWAYCCACLFLAWTCLESWQQYQKERERKTTIKRRYKKTYYVIWERNDNDRKIEERKQKKKLKNAAYEWK